MIPSMFTYALLQCLNNVLPVFLCSGITTCYLPTTQRSCSCYLSLLLVHVIFLSCYVKFSASCTQTWTGFSKETLSHIPAFMKLGVPSAVMVCLELWSFELSVLLSGLLPNPVLETATLSICLNTPLTVWMIPVGLGGTASTRISTVCSRRQFPRLFPVRAVRFLHQ